MFRRSVVPVDSSRLRDSRVCEIEKARIRKQNGRKPFLDHALIYSRALHLRVILVDLPTSRAHRHGEHSLFAGKSALKCV